MVKRRAPSPRFRTDDPAPNVQLQPNDIEILWHTYCNRVISSSDIHTLFPSRSKQRLTRRLNEMRKGSDPYIHRLAQSNSRLMAQKGSVPYAYGLGGLGAHALCLHRGVEVPTARWSEKNGQLTVPTVAHELATTRFMVRMWRDAASAENVNMFYQNEFPDDLLARRRGISGLQNSLRARIDKWHGYRGDEGTAPDRIFALDDLATRKRKFLFLEIDQGTETIVPGDRGVRSTSFWRGASVLRKLVIYSHAFESGAHKRQFGFPAFQVLMVTTSPIRAENMRAACQQHLPRARDGLFLFSDWETIERRVGPMHELDWQTVKGRPFALVN